MALRGGGLMLGDRRNELEEAAFHEQEILSDDDNAQPDALEQEVEVEDPLVLAIDDLEGRVVAALDEVKLHPGIRSDSMPGAPSVHEELALLLRPVLEVAAHTAPSIARTYYRGEGPDGVEASVEDVYQRVISDLVLPVLLEMAQSERNAAKLSASLEFFHHFWKECQKAGSWLDSTTTTAQAGPYGAGGSSHGHAAVVTPAMRALTQRRQIKRMTREGELLRYWVQASIACTEPGVLTSEEGEGAVAARGVIAAAASIRPSLRHISQRIKDTDDRGASRLYGPVMRMVEGVFKQLFLGNPNESVRSACIKFLEIVVMCCSHKASDASTRRRGQNTSEEYSLDDLPAGHPIITREALESIGEYAFTTLRGLTLLGGQIKIDANLLQDMLLVGGGSPSAQVVSILKPAALAYLEIESNLPNFDDPEADVLEYTLDRSSLEYDFELSQKSYALAINAISALGTNRPVFFKEAAVCLARRAMQPPLVVDGGPLSQSAILALSSQLRASCLTLLRNSLSVTQNSHDILFRALKSFDMEVQAEKALSMAKQATALKTAGRAARNRANMYYEWDASDSDRLTRRQRETDDALAKMRAAKAARGLGHGIQLPTSMSDAVELILANLMHLPSKRPQTAKASKIAMTLDSIVDAVMTNGASLSHEEGQWYERDGSSAWTIELQGTEVRYAFDGLIQKSIESKAESEGKDDERTTKRRKVFFEQGEAASSSAVHRIIQASINTRSHAIRKLGSQLASRLAFVLQGTKPTSSLDEQLLMAKESVESISKRVDEETLRCLKQFVSRCPHVAASLVVDAMPSAFKENSFSMGETVLNEAFLQCCSIDMNGQTKESFADYDFSLSLYVAAMVYAGEISNQKPADVDRKKAATDAVLKLQRTLPQLPRLTSTSMLLLVSMCDIDEISKKATAAQRQPAMSQDFIAAAAALHAAKVAAEKRAKAVLIILKDIALQRDSKTIRESIVQSAVGVAAGRLPCTQKIQDLALNLVVNVLFSHSDGMSDMVVAATVAELERASNEAIASYEGIQKANKEAEGKDESLSKNPLAPCSDKEKILMEQMRGPAVMYMAICVRRPELIGKLFELSSLSKADALSKAVRASMGKLSKASAARHGNSSIALKVAEMCGRQELPMLLSFLESLAKSGDTSNHDQIQEVIEACFKIQEMKQSEDMTKDPRFIIPVVPYMLRKELVAHLPSFVVADDNVFLAALVHMGDRLGRQALLFREEPDEDQPTLRGLTLCEQLVFLHRLDFSACSLPQKRYLAAIKICLEDEETFNDQVVMSALDQMSGSFLTGEQKLPLAFMRTCILVCSQHESLHSWICHELLPRLVEGKIYEDARQWEGWMRCAHMLENNTETGVTSAYAISKLPLEQVTQYRAKWERR